MNVSPAAKSLEIRGAPAARSCEAVEELRKVHVVKSKPPPAGKRGVCRRMAWSR
jgi:hypothetical protein